ncbi:hypothetical protein [Pseudonocardia bannensis]|uniref:hypothetical protein n=1 Tax=Pseudonocardia bannensis TaxID=630973 RepID=UPI001FE5EDA9|nr:hypothetical protein [Pseudonocardia bannensis]
MSGTTISLDRALELTRTGDIWVFRGRSGADRAIRGLTNSPVNHVGMSIVIDDLPPLMWHAELGRSLPDLWSGRHQRGVQLHDLRDAVLQWGHRYGQRGWLRQLDGPVTREHEDAALRTVARLDGTPFPSTTRLASRWLRGRAPQAQELARGARYSRRRTARRSSPSPTRRWGCCPPTAGPTGTTPGGSGAVTTSSSQRASGWAGRSRCGCRPRRRNRRENPHRPRSGAGSCPDGRGETEPTSAAGAAASIVLGAATAKGPS